MITKTILTLSILFSLAGTIWAGDLIDTGIGNIPGVWAGSIDLGDYDDDGDLDLLITGQTGSEGDPAFGRIARVYTNTGGAFPNSGMQELEDGGIYFGSAIWGDYDNDGDLDIALSGWDEDNHEIARIYENNNGRFEEDIIQDQIGDTHQGRTGFKYSSLAFGDYDGDGDLDLVIMGMHDRGFASTTIYRNEDGRFVIDQANSEAIADLNKGDVAFGDYDDDGDLDLVITGFSAQGARASFVYKNDPLGTFLEDISVNLEKVTQGSLAWGDFDNDGDDDLALSGWNNLWQSKIIIYKNNPTGTLVEDRFFSRTFTKGLVGSLSWGDFDNDGDLDLSAIGQNQFSQKSVFVLKNDNGVLAEDATQENLIGLVGGSGDWGDYNDDGNLDLISSGEGSDGQRVSLIYGNDEDTGNLPPDQPISLERAIVTDTKVTFVWGSGSDDITTERDLTYNLRLGDDSNPNKIISGLSRVGIGNIGKNNSKALSTALEQGDFLWSVQTVDSGFRKSEWSPARKLTIQRFVDSNQRIKGMRSSATGWGDMDNDGDLDLILAGENFDGRSQTIFYRNYDGILEKDDSVGIFGLWDGDVGLGDFDNDGDLGIVITGQNTFGNDFFFGKTTTLYTL